MSRDHFSKQLPIDNVYLVKTAEDLPNELSQWTLYNLQYDPGAGAGLYFSPDGVSLVRVDGGGGGGGAFSGFGLWRFRTETTAPPASGQIRFDNADPELAANVFIAETNQGGTDMSAFLGLLVAGSLIYFQEQGNASNFIIVEVATNTDSGTYRTIGIANVEQQGGAISQNTTMILVGSAAGAGGGGAVTSVFGRTGAVVALVGDYAGLYVDSFAGRTGVVSPIVGDYAGLYVDSFIGRTGPVVALEADYASFYLRTAVVFGGQTVASDVDFTGDVEFNNIQGVRFGPSTEVELRNPNDDSTWFLQYTSFFCEFGVSGVDFQDIPFNFSNSFTHFRFGAPIFLQERSTAESNPSTFGQLWVRNDDPNVLMFTDGNGDDWVVDLTAA